MKKLKMFGVLLFSLCVVTSCTLSFTNVSIVGKGTDVVDSDPSNDVKTDADISNPMSIPGIL